MHRRRSVRALALLAACVAVGSGCGSPPAADPSKPKGTSSSTGVALPGRPLLAGEAMFFLDTDRAVAQELAFAPDGAQIAVAHGAHKLSIRSARDGAVRLLLDTPGVVTSLGFRDDGARLCAVTELGAVVWDAKTGAPVLSRALPTLGLGKRAMFSPSGRWLVTVERTGSMRVMDAETGAIAAAVAVTPGTRIERFASASDRLLTWSGKAYELWEIPSGKKLSERSAGDYSPDLRVALVKNDSEGTLRLVDAGHGAELWKHVWGTYRSREGGEVTTQPVATHEAVWSADGARVALMSHVPRIELLAGSAEEYQAQLSVLDVAARKLTVQRFRVGHRTPEWSRDGKLLFVGRPPPDRLSTPERIALDVATGQPLTRAPAPGLDPQNPADSTGSIAFPYDSGGLKAVDGKTGAVLWRVAEPSVPYVPPRYGRAVVSRSAPWIAFTESDAEKDVLVLRLDRGASHEVRSDLEGLPRDLIAAGNTLVGLGAGRRNEGVQVWTWNEGESPKKTMTAGDRSVASTIGYGVKYALDLSDDGRYLAMGNGNDVELYDAKTGRLLVKLSGEEPVVGLQFEAAGTLLVIDRRSRIQSVRVPGGEALAEFPGSPWRMRQDGALMVVRRREVTASSKSTVVLDPKTGKELAWHKCDHRDAYSWSADGTLAIMNDGVWDAATCNRALPLPTAASAEFSSDGRHVVVVFDAEGAALVISTATWAVERVVRVPPGSAVIGASGDFVALRTHAGAVMIRPGTGAVYRVDLVEGAGGARVVASLDRGHFEAPDDVASHVRLFVAGVKDGPVVRMPGAGQETFRRKELHKDFFASP